MGIRLFSLLPLFFFLCFLISDVICMIFHLYSSSFFSPVSSMLEKINYRYFVTQLTEFKVRKEVKRVLKIKVKHLQQCFCSPKAKGLTCSWWLQTRTFSILAASLTLPVRFVMAVTWKEGGTAFTWGLPSFPSYRYWDNGRDLFRTGR